LSARLQRAIGGVEKSPNGDSALMPGKQSANIENVFFTLRDVEKNGMEKNILVRVLRHFRTASKILCLELENGENLFL